MQEEKERTRDRVGGGDDGGSPIEESPQALGAGDAAQEELKKKAENVKKDLEKYRKRSRERATRLEKDDTQVNQSYQESGQ